MADRGRGRGQRGYRGQRGGGRGRGGVSGSGDTSSNGQVCLDFQRTGACKRSNCRFSHNLSEHRPAQRAAKPDKVKETLEQRHAKRSYDAWKVHLGSDPNDARTMQRFWERALKILEGGDRDCRQELPKDLDADDDNHKGRQHIDALMSKRAHDGEPDRFIADCQQFLLTVTHPSLLDGLAVTTYVDSLYKYMNGGNGTRAIPFFRHLCGILIATRQSDGPSTSSEIIDSTLLAMTIALRELVRRESQVRCNQDLEGLIGALYSAAHIIAPEKPTNISAPILSHLRSIRDMVARANGLLINDAAVMTDVSPRSNGALSSPRNLIIPRDRHDNDKLDISKIVIFPTRDEIMSDAKECLPYTNPDLPHFLHDPVQRHIDTHFRLFRHDIFGELKAALRGLMSVFARNKNAINDPNLKLGDLRAYHYTGAHISNIVFKRALEAQITFQLPSAIRRKMPAEQQRWWDESRRLEEGALLSFIWVQAGIVQHLFLTVAMNTENSLKLDSLRYDRQHTTIPVRLTTQNKSTLDLLMKANASQARGILLEFPKIMPATFVPILENLQSMQRLGYMPFDRWIVPARHDGPPSAKVYHNIQPPLYARHAGFSFPLKTITEKEDDGLSVDSTASCDDNDLLEKMEVKTSLDRAQCRALLAALTREFAFIQGPPGTGKSFLGLQLMKVLLDIRRTAKLGPVLVV